MVFSYYQIRHCVFFFLYSQVFVGNGDRNSTVTETIPDPVSLSYIRIEIIVCSEEGCALRFELYDDQCTGMLVQCIMSLFSLWVDVGCVCICRAFFSKSAGHTTIKLGEGVASSW